MYLDIVILSHLLHRPAHGYELKRNVSATTAFTLHNNSLYPALRRFEEAGALTRTAQPQEGRPPRHVYELTDVGRELLRDMIAELPADLAGTEEEFLTRLGLFDLLSRPERLGVLAARTAALTSHGEHLRTLAGQTTNSRTHRDWGGTVVAELLRRNERELAWLDELRERA